MSENLSENEDENEDLNDEAVQEETGLTEEPAKEGEETLETTEEQSEEKEFEEQVEDTAEIESEEASDLPLEEEKVTESISDRLALKAKEIQDDTDIDDSKPGTFNAKISKDGSLVPGFNGDGEAHGIMGTSFSIPQTDVITEQSYCYDRENKNLLVSYKEDGTIKKYVYGNGLISTDERNDSDGSMIFLVYLYDLRGSVTEEMDASGNKKGEYRYSTYGIRTTISGATTEVGYCGRDGVLSDGVGLLYMRARYYNPHINRFINQDIITGDISNSNSLNRYAYVEGNPATLIDPFGLCAVKTEDAFSRAMSTLDQGTVVNNLILLLKNCGWSEDSYSYTRVTELYLALKKHGITTTDSVCALLASCMKETSGGRFLIESMELAAANSDKYSADYRGGGFIQLSLDYGYKAYATYKIFESIPELKNYMASRDDLRSEAAYIAPAGHSRVAFDDRKDAIRARYANVVFGAQEMIAEMENANKDTSSIKAELQKCMAIVDIGADYVSAFYAWDSAAYYWSEAQLIHPRILSGEFTIEKALEAVNTKGTSLDERIENYNFIHPKFAELIW